MSQLWNVVIILALFEIHSESQSSVSECLASTLFSILLLLFLLFLFSFICSSYSFILCVTLLSAFISEWNLTSKLCSSILSYSMIYTYMSRCVYICSSLIYKWCSGLAKCVHDENSMKKCSFAFRLCRGYKRQISIHLMST